MELDENGNPIPDGPGDPRPDPLSDCPRCGPVDVEMSIGVDRRSRMRCVTCGYRLG